MLLTQDQLKRIVAAGGGLTVDATVTPFNQLRDLCAAATAGSGSIDIINCGGLTALQMTELAAVAPGRVHFDLTR